MTYQYGDGCVVIGGRVYTLRLTMGGLAELDAKFRISGPTELASRLRSATPQDGRKLLEVLATEPLAATLSDTDIAALMPELCRVMETAFGETHV